MATPLADSTGIQTFDFTTGVMLDFEPLMQQLDPYDTPLLSGLGADGNSVIAKTTCFEVKVEWQEEEGLTRRSTAVATIATSDTTITMAFAQRARFQTNDIIIVDQEYMKVAGYNATSNLLDVTRAFSGTQIQHNNASQLVGVGSANAEGADPNNARARDRDSAFNYTEIFGPDQIAVTGTENAVRKYGLTGTEFDKQVANRIREHAIMLEQTVLYGVRTIDTSAATRTMGGFNYYITTNVNTATTDITESSLLDSMETVFNAGGRVSVVVTGARQKRKISQFQQSSIRYEVTDRSRGQVVDFYDSDFGRITLLLDRWVRPNDLFGVSREQVELTTLRPLIFVPLAKTGDRDKGMVLSEKSLRFGLSTHAFKYTGLQ